MLTRVNLIVMSSAVVLLLVVLNQVRRRLLHEEYSWLWLLTSVSYLILTISPVFYKWVANLIGANNAVLAFTFLGLYFLIFLSLQYSAQLSKLGTKNKNLAQQVAVLDGEIKKLQEETATLVEKIRILETERNAKEQAKLVVEHSFN